MDRKEKHFHLFNFNKEFRKVKCYFFGRYIFYTEKLIDKFEDKIDTADNLN